jgi:hypothetical protein
MHLILCGITALISLKLPGGGAWYRIIPINLPWSVSLVVLDGWLPIFIVFFVLGTAQWWFIGKMGWLSRRHEGDRVLAALGAAIGLLNGVIGARGSVDTLRSDLHQGLLTGGAVIQYVCVGLLCVGALISGLYSAAAALRSS